MNNYTLRSSALVYERGSSQGTQTKFYEEGYWYKQDRLGYEGEAEWLASVVLSCSNIVNFVKYEKCKINGKTGCRAKHFLGKNESFMSFQRLYDMYEGGELLGRILPMNNIEERIRFVVTFIKQITGYDCSEYLAQKSSVACLLLDTDMHFHNLGIILDSKTNEVRGAPLFDNGKSLMSDYSRFPYSTIEENLMCAVGMPFSSNLEMQAYYAGYSLKIDYKKLYEKISNIEQTRAVDVLRYQLERHEKIFS